MFGTYRTILALMVVALHLGGASKLGAYAVFGFYTLSGFLMTFIMQKSYGYTAHGLKKYAINRFLRIYPPYWVSITLSAAIVFLLGRSFTEAYHPAIYIPYDTGSLLKNLFLFFPNPLENPRLTPPAWALTVEIFFYFLIGLGISKTRRRVIIWLIVSIAYHLIINALDWGWSSRYYSVYAASLPFSLGSAIFLFQKELKNISKTLTSLNYLAAPSVLLAIIFNWALGHIFQASDSTFFYTNLILCALMIIVLIEGPGWPFIDQKLDTIFGDLSYPIYLTHYQVGLLVLILISNLGISIERPEPIFFFLALPPVLCFAYLMSFLIDKPIDSIRTKVKLD